MQAGLLRIKRHTKPAYTHNGCEQQNERPYDKSLYHSLDPYIGVGRVHSGAHLKGERMASSRTVPVASAVVAQLSFAGLGRRLAAYLVDLAISASIFFPLTLTMWGLRGVGLWTPATARTGDGHDLLAPWRALGTGSKLAVATGFVLSMGIIYYTLLESSAWQATLGKRLLGLYVTDDEGRRIGGGRALGRWFCKFFLAYFWVNIASLATIPFSKNKKAMHDYAARTLVLRGRPAPGGSLETWRVVVAFGIPFVWLVATFLATL